MLSPYNILKNIKSDKLIASHLSSCGLRVHIGTKKDDFDKHYHEFEIKTVQLFTTADKLENYGLSTLDVSLIHLKLE